MGHTTEVAGNLTWDAVAMPVCNDAQAEHAVLRANSQYHTVTAGAHRSNAARARRTSCGVLEWDYATQGLQEARRRVA